MIESDSPGDALKSELEVDCVLFDGGNIRGVLMVHATCLATKCNIKTLVEQAVVIFWRFSGPTAINHLVVLVRD